MVAHTCNPSYLGGRDQEDLSLRPTWVKIPIETNKSGMVVHPYDPSYVGDTSRKMSV
jgi:hypothetical protein